jgi:formate dehydrogenase subunit gamma
VSDVLVQPQGRTWRDAHNDKLAYGGALYVFGVSLLIAMFLAWRGRVPMKEPESGLKIERFSAFERANHWLTAVSFILMALTGLIILYGNAVIRPWLGASAYAELARTSAWSHMMFAVPFVIGVIVMIGLWTRQNLPERLDWEWLKQGGGFLRDRGDNPPARKFNAGQKLVFWSVAIGGALLTLTGVALMFPFYWAGYTGMQWAQGLHSAIALLMIGLIIGHIYIGTIGMVGAIDAMWSGRVDRNWAKEHHQLWYRDADARGVEARTGRRASGTGAFATGTVVALIAAIVMIGVYNYAGSSTTAHNSGSNPAVHVDTKTVSVQDRAR